MRNNMKKRVVVALGGNALGNSLPEQKIAVKSTAKTIIDLVEADCDVVVTHGNGPQIGMINNAMAALTREVEGQPNTPLSVCVAMSQAYIGYDLQNALHEELLNRGIKDLPTMTMVTQVLVDQNDSAFQNPTKPIGHFMTQEEAEYAEKNYDYVVKEDAGRGYRRVVASPAPKEIIELEAIKAQVVASRTFVYSRLLSVDNTTNTQVYLDDEKMKVSWSDHYEEYKEKVQKAIVETKGEILTYQGKWISALFYSSSNGKSENVENYFKGSSQPYLVSVDSHWDQEYDPQFIRKVKYTKAQLNSLFGGSFQYRFLEHYPSGRVKSILINQKQYSGREVREKLQLSSSDFEIVKEGNSYIFVTKGCGHGVGLSQYGAQGMAKEGYNYQAILKHYYQRAEISKNKE